MRGWRGPNYSCEKFEINAMLISTLQNAAVAVASGRVELIRMLWTEIIAEIEAEITRLQRARDFLAAAPANSKTAGRRKTKKKSVFGRKKKQPIRSSAPAASGSPDRGVAAPALAQAEEVPRVQLVPPKRRVERQRRLARSATVDSPPAVLSGTVPSGPIVVSADEARKAQERSTNLRSAPSQSEARSHVRLRTQHRIPHSGV